MQIRKFVLSCLLAASVVVLQGCLVVAVGAGAAGTVAYVKGDLETVESANIDKVYDATLHAMDRMKLPIIAKTKDAMTAKITSRDAQDKKVTITLTAAADRSTKITIRVGTFGDQSKSVLIYDEIKKGL